MEPTHLAQPIGIHTAPVALCRLAVWRRAASLSATGAVSRRGTVPYHYLIKSHQSARQRRLAGLQPPSCGAGRLGERVTGWGRISATADRLNVHHAGNEPPMEHQLTTEHQPPPETERYRDRTGRDLDKHHQRGAEYPQTTKHHLQWHVIIPTQQNILSTQQTILSTAEYELRRPIIV